MARKQEVKEYIKHSPPWWDNNGSGCVDPDYGVTSSFIKDKIFVPVSFQSLTKKFGSTGSSRPGRCSCCRWPAGASEAISFLSQDGLIFFLFQPCRPVQVAAAAARDRCRSVEFPVTTIWQLYFDDNYKYPPNIKNARKETTAFKRWLLSQI